MADSGAAGKTLEFTPSWVVALACFSIVLIYLAVDTLGQCVSQRLKKKRSKWWPLVRGSRKIKDELMRLGLISLLLTVFQTGIGKICISERLDTILLPCKKPYSSSAVANFNTSSFASGATRGRRLLSVASNSTDYCSKKGKMPLLSVEAVHQLDVFIFVLATFHVVLCVLKALYMTVQWRHLETYDKEIGSANKPRQQEGNVLELILLKQCDKMEEILLEILVESPKEYSNLIELISSLQISFTSLTKEEYIALCLNFFAARDPEGAEKDFQEYIIRILEKEFEKMIGISWFSWFLTVIYMLMNVAGWNAYFWISFIPFTILFVIGGVLEFMMMRIVTKLAKNHTQNENASSENGAEEKFYVIPNNDRWNFMGNLIHVMLFLNSLELAVFFFMLIQYGFHSCMMGKVGFVVSRIVMGLYVQICYMSRALPLYAIMKSQMHLEQQLQLDKHNKIHEIKMHLKEYLTNEHAEKCLNEIKMWLKEKQMDEGEDMQILTWISELIDHRKNRREQPNSPEESTNTELAGRSGARDPLELT